MATVQQEGLYMQHDARFIALFILDIHGDELRTRFSKHGYDTKTRPDNNELTANMYEHKYDFEKDLDVAILKDKVFTKAEREYYEDRFICLVPSNLMV